ncbi:MAG: glutamine synthetase family protein [Actinomycetota bacterium]
MTTLEGINWVRLSFVDVFGVGHSMQIPAARFDAAVKEGEPFDGSALEGRARLLETDMRLQPDPSTLVTIGDGLARAVCNVLTFDGRRWPGDPRTALVSVVEDLGDLAQEYTASVELEFFLLDQQGLPIDRGGYFDEDEGRGAVVVRRAADQLGAFGVDVDASHHEAGPGQYEVDLAPIGPFALADAIVLTKQVIREAAGDAGMRATFMPRPFAAEPGSGLHLHQRVAEHFFADDGSLHETGRSFVAGQLIHARALTALAAPTVNSYKRLHSGAEAPTAAVWAHVNRGALIRVSSYMGRDASIEFRGADPSANPHLLLAGLLVAGADGVERELTLPPAVEEDLAGFDPAGSDSVRFDALPRDLDDALDALVSDDVMVDAFDRQLLSRLIDGRRAEAASYRNQVTSWEVERYLDEA